MLKASVDEIMSKASNSHASPDHLLDQINQQHIDKIGMPKQPEMKVPLLNQQPETTLNDPLLNANIKTSDNDNNKAKEKKRGRKRKSEVVGSTPMFPAYVAQRKSAKKASLSITKNLEGEKRYKQQDIGKFMKKVKKLESKIKDSEFEVEPSANNSTMDNTRELIDDIDKLLQDSDEEVNFGEDINYDNSSVGEEDSLGDIGEMQDYIEFSDSDGEETEGLNYSIKVENMSFSGTNEEENDIPQIQGEKIRRPRERL